MVVDKKQNVLTALKKIVVPGSRAGARDSEQPLDAQVSRIANYTLCFQKFALPLMRTLKVKYR